MRTSAWMWREGNHGPVSLSQAVDHFPICPGGEGDFPTSFIGLTTAPIGPNDNEIHFQPLQPKSATEADMVDPTSLVLRSLQVPLLHYLPAVRFLQLLRSGHLHMTSLSEQGKDPKDGTFPSANATAPVGINEQYYKHFATIRDVPSMLAQHENLRRQTYIHCWYSSLMEDRRMWEDFADNGRGVILCSSSSDLLRALSPFNEDFLLSIDKVRYIEEETQLIEFIPDLPTLRKGTDFSSENEVRIFARRKEDRITKPTLPTSTAIKAPIDLAKCLHAIIFGPIVCEDVANRIAKRVRAILPRVKTLQSAFRGKWFSGKPQGW